MLFMSRVPERSWRMSLRRSTSAQNVIDNDNMVHSIEGKLAGYRTADGSDGADFIILRHSMAVLRLLASRVEASVINAGMALMKTLTVSA